MVHHLIINLVTPPNGLQARCAALIPRLAYAWRFIGGYLTQAHYSPRLQLWNSDGKYQNPVLHAEDSLTNVLTVHVDSFRFRDCPEGKSNK